MKLIDRLLGPAGQDANCDSQSTSRPAAGRVRKAVFPVAGSGTRFLPATKAMPKELLPVVDRPLVQYAVDEAVAAGIEEIIFVTNRHKRAIEDHFDVGGELESRLARDGNQRALAALRDTVPHGVRFSFVRQTEPRGLGHAVACARHLVGDEPFAVVLPDDLMLGEPPVLAQMVEQFDRTPSHLLAVQNVPRELTSRYGIVDAAVTDARLARVRSLVEKPAPADAPSTLGVVGRYILLPSVFDALAEERAGSGGEIQLTDAIAARAATEPVFAFSFDGQRFDCGSKIGFLEATVAFALRHPEVAQDFERVLGEVVRQAQVESADTTGAAASPAAARRLSLVTS